MRPSEVTTSIELKPFDKRHRNGQKEHSNIDVCLLLDSHQMMGAANGRHKRDSRLEHRTTQKGKLLMLMSLILVNRLHEKRASARTHARILPHTHTHRGDREEGWERERERERGGGGRQREREREGCWGEEGVNGRDGEEGWREREEVSMFWNVNGEAFCKVKWPTERWTRPPTQHPCSHMQLIPESTRWTKETNEWIVADKE